VEHMPIRRRPHAVAASPAGSFETSGYSLERGYLGEGSPS
jgi:hypothetical protein